MAKYFAHVSVLGSPPLSPNKDSVFATAIDYGNPEFSWIQFVDTVQPTLGHTLPTKTIVDKLNSQILCPIYTMKL